MAEIYKELVVALRKLSLYNEKCIESIPMIGVSCNVLMDVKSIESWRFEKE